MVVAYEGYQLQEDAGSELVHSSGSLSECKIQMSSILLLYFEEFARRRWREIGCCIRAWVLVI